MKCGHCQTGFTYCSYGQWVCLNCGWRHNPVISPPPRSVGVNGHQLPTGSPRR